MLLETAVVKSVFFDVKVFQDHMFYEVFMVILSLFSDPDLTPSRNDPINYNADPSANSHPNCNTM